MIATRDGKFLTTTVVKLLFQQQRVEFVLGTAKKVSVFSHMICQLCTVQHLAPCLHITLSIRHYNNCVEGELEAGGV